MDNIDGGRPVRQPEKEQRRVEIFIVVHCDDAAFRWRCIPMVFLLLRRQCHSIGRLRLVIWQRDGFCANTKVAIYKESNVAE